MIYKCEHEHGGARTVPCMYGCNAAVSIEAPCRECGRDVDHFIHGFHAHDTARAKACGLANHEYAEPNAETRCNATMAGAWVNDEPVVCRALLGHTGWHSANGFTWGTTPLEAATQNAYEEHKHVIEQVAIELEAATGYERVHWREAIATSIAQLDMNNTMMHPERALAIAVDTSRSYPQDVAAVEVTPSVALPATAGGEP